jgi:hypothetical protein
MTRRDASPLGAVVWCVVRGTRRCGGAKFQEPLDSGGDRLCDFLQSRRHLFEIVLPGERHARVLSREPARRRDKRVRSQSLHTRGLRQQPREFLVLKTLADRQPQPVRVVDVQLADEVQAATREQPPPAARALLELDVAPAPQLSQRPRGRNHETMRLRARHCRGSSVTPRGIAGRPYGMGERQP